MQRTQFGAVMLWGALAAAGLLLLSGLPSPAVAGLLATNRTLNYDANTETDLTWQSDPDVTANRWPLHASVTLDTGVSAIPGIVQAYTFTGAGGASNQGLDNLSGNPSDASASWEFWIRPDAGTDTDRIFETGGSGDGMSIVYDGTNSQAVFTVDDGGVQRQVRGGSSLFDTSDFHQLVAVYERDFTVGNEDLLQLYVDGILVDDSDPGTTVGPEDGADPALPTILDDWDGGDTSTLGVTGTGLAQTTPADTNYEGRIAIFRFYEQTLSGAEVLGNYNAVTAADVFFDDGGTDSDWGTDANWDTDLQPTSGQNAFVNGGLAAEVTLSGEVAKTLTVGSNSTGGPNTPGAGTLTVTGGGLAVSNDITIGDGNTGTVNVNGGTLSVSNNITIADSSTGTLNVNGGTLSVGGSINDGAGTSTINYDGGTLATGSTNITVDNFNINPDSTPDTPNLTYTRTGGTLTVNNNLQLGGEGKSTITNYHGNLTQTGGDVNVGVDLLFGGTSGPDTEGGTYNLRGGSLNVAGDIVEGASGSPDSGVDAAQLHIDGGTLNVTGSITVQRFAVGNDAGYTGSYEITGGQTVKSTGTTAIAGSGTGVLTLTDGTLTSGNAYIAQTATGASGTAHVNGGTWNVLTVLGVGYKGTGVLNINSGALAVTNTLINGSGTTGTGLLHIIGDDATINVGGYSQNSLSTLEVDINGISPINVAGGVDLDGYLDVEFLAWPGAGVEFTLIANNLVDKVTGNYFIGKPEGALFMADGAPFLVEITYEGGTDDNDVVLRTTPEPATLSLLALGALGLLARRRRRH